MSHPDHLSPTSDPQEEQLDSEISSIRAEIRALQRRRRFLASSLVSSTAIQKHLQKPSSIPSTLDSSTASISPLVRVAGKHTEANHHRIAFGTTTFPFKDPSPTAGAGATESGANLLGVRIDVCARNGRFTKPYYVLLRRVRGRGGDAEKRLRVHRHTVPAFISIAKLESAYLPVPISRERRGEGDEDRDSDEGADAEGPLKPSRKTGKSAMRKQDLRRFVRELRRELVAWHVRADAVDLLREKLRMLDSGQSVTSSQDVRPVEGTGILSLTPTALEARYVRLEWTDGRVGRFKLSNAGVVERAVVIGDQGRDKTTEDAMTGGGGRVEFLLERLKACAVPRTS